MYYTIEQFQISGFDIELFQCSPVKVKQFSLNNDKWMP